MRSKNIYSIIAVTIATTIMAGCSERTKAPITVGSIQPDTLHRHPIRVSKDKLVLNIPISMTAGMVHMGGGMKDGGYLAQVRPSLSPMHRDQLMDFIAQCKKARSKITMANPVGILNEGAAAEISRDIYTTIARQGLLADQIINTTYNVGMVAEGNIIVSCDRYTAEAPLCGDWSDDITNNGKNLPYNNFGCATQQNLAAMIANPQDLISARPMGLSGGHAFSGWGSGGKSSGSSGGSGGSSIGGGSSGGGGGGGGSGGGGGGGACQL
jgi:pilus assembly protein CpaD